LLRKDNFSRSDEEWEYVRVSVARAIGIACDNNLSATLLAMLKDTSPRVIEAAIVSAGKCKEREFIPLLIERLNMKLQRKQARTALAQYGEDSIEFLIRYFDEPSSPYRLRLEILKVLAMIGTKRSVEILASRLKHSDPPLRYETIRALNKVRLQLRELNLDRRYLNEAILREVRSYSQTSLILNRFRAKDASLGPANDDAHVTRQFLVKALEEKLETDLERTFRLLGLRHSPQDMYNAYLGVMSNRADLRANAIELLDNVLDTRLKPYIIPIVDAKSGSSPETNDQKVSDYRVPSMQEAVTNLLEGEDNWLRVCTLQFVAKSRAREFLPLTKSLLTNPDPLVRESAEYTWRALEAAA
jgi:AAA family ATP:ADP antiporter